MNVIAEQNKHFILFVVIRRILILFNFHTSDTFFVDNAGPLMNGGRGAYLSPTFSESTLQVCYAGNSLLCHSPKHPKLIWPRHSQNLVRGPALAILILTVIDIRNNLRMIWFEAETRGIPVEEGLRLITS